MLLGVVLRALGGVWSAFGDWWGLWGRVLKSAAVTGQVRVLLDCCLLPAACCLTYDFC